MGEPKPIDLTPSTNNESKPSKIKKLTGGLAFATATTLLTGAAVNAPASQNTKPSQSVEVSSSNFGFGSTPESSTTTTATPETTATTVPDTTTSVPETTTTTFIDIGTGITATTQPQTTPNTQPEPTTQHPQQSSQVAQLPETK